MSFKLSQSCGDPDIDPAPRRIATADCASMITPRLSESAQGHKSLLSTSVQRGMLTSRPNSSHDREFPARSIVEDYRGRTPVVSSHYRTGSILWSTGVHGGWCS